MAARIEAMATVAAACFVLLFFPLLASAFYHHPPLPLLCRQPPHTRLSTAMDGAMSPSTTSSSSSSQSQAPLLRFAADAPGVLQHIQPAIAALLAGYVKGAREGKDDRERGQRDGKSEATTPWKKRHICIKPSLSNRRGIKRKKGKKNLGDYIRETELTALLVR